MVPAPLGDGHLVSVPALPFLSFGGVRAPIPGRGDHPCQGNTGSSPARPPVNTAGRPGETQGWSTVELQPAGAGGQPGQLTEAPQRCTSQRGGCKMWDPCPPPRHHSSAKRVIKSAPHPLPGPGIWGPPMDSGRWL